MPKFNNHGQAEILDDLDYAKLFKVLKNPKHALFLEIARYTGERWGALCQLKVGDVWNEDRIPREAITFRSVTRKADNKGKRQTHQVPISDHLRKILVSHAAQQPNIFSQIWLFPGRNPLKPMSFEAAFKFFRLAVVNAGMKSRGISTHSTRRSFITTLHRRGVDLVTLRLITGHHDLKSLQRYIEIDAQRVRNAIALL